MNKSALFQFFRMGLISVLIFPVLVQADDFCQEWNSLDQAPDALYSDILLDVLEESAVNVLQARKDVLLSAEQRKKLEKDFRFPYDLLDGALAENMALSSARYCERNQKRSKSRNPKDLYPYLKSCVVNYHPNWNTFDIISKELTQTIQDKKLERRERLARLQNLLQVSGLVPKASRICCSNTETNWNPDQTCENSADEKTKKQAMNDQKKWHHEMEKIGIDAALRTVNEAIKLNKNLEAEIHPSCLLPSEPKKTSLRSSKKSSPTLVGSLYKAVGAATVESLERGVPSSLDSAVTASIVAAGGKTQPSGSSTVSSSATSEVWSWLKSVGNHTLLLSSGIDPDAYFESIVGLPYEQSDPRIDETLAEYREQTKKIQFEHNDPREVYFTKHWKKIDASILELKRKKANGLLFKPDQKKSAVIKALEAEHGGYLRQSELDKETLEQIKELKRALRLTAIPLPVHGREVAIACDKIIDVHPEFKRWLLERAASMATDQDPEGEKEADISKATYLAGVPGIFKTYGINQLSKCTKVPLCTISSQDIIGQAAPEKVENPILERLKDQVRGCLKTSLQIHGQLGFHSQGVILLDDFEKILNHVTPESTDRVDQNAANTGVETKTDATKTAEAAAKVEDKKREKLRAQIMDYLKNLTDPSQRLIDSKTGFSIQVPKVQLFITGNTILKEFKSKDGGEGSAGTNRFNEVLDVPIPDRAFRQAKAEQKFKRIESQLKGSQIELNQDCRKKLNEIVEYDAKISADKKSGRLGMRPIFSFLNKFKGFIQAQALQISSTDNDAAMKSKLSCNQFNIDQEGGTIPGYSGGPDQDIVEYNFDKHLEKVLPELKKEMDAAGASLPPDVQGILYNIIDSSDYGTKKSNLATLEKRLKFILYKKFGRDELTQRFKLNLRDLLAEKAVRKKWGSAAQAILDTRNSNDPKFHMIVADVKSVGDPFLFEKLADVFDSPSIVLSEADVKVDLDLSKY